MADWAHERSNLRPSSMVLCPLICRTSIMPTSPGRLFATIVVQLLEVVSGDSIETSSWKTGKTLASWPPAYPSPDTNS